jgi:hypothetical protein
MFHAPWRAQFPGNAFLLTWYHVTLATEYMLMLGPYSVHEVMSLSDSSVLPSNIVVRHMYHLVGNRQNILTVIRSLVRIYCTSITDALLTYYCRRKYSFEQIRNVSFTDIHRDTFVQPPLP